MRRGIRTLLAATLALLLLAAIALLILYRTTELTPVGATSGSLLPAVFVPAGVLSGDETIYLLAAPPYAEPSTVLRAAVFLRFDEGWSDQEGWGTWTVGPKSVFRVWFPEPADRSFSLRGWALEHPQHPEGQQLTVHINGHPCGSMAIASTTSTATLRVPAAVQRAGFNRIELHSAYQVSQVELGTGSDERQLAVGICALGFAVGERAAELPSERSLRITAMLERLGLRSPAFEVDPDNGSFTVRAPGTVVIPPIPAASDDRVLTVRSSSSFDPDASNLQVSTLGLGGSEQAGASTDARSWQRQPGGGWCTEQMLMPLGSEPGAPGGESEMAGLAGNLTIIAVDPQPPGSWLRFSSPLLRAHSGARVVTTTQPPVAPPAERPDLVLITLDAARPDHLGCYGYQRDTTPRIDELARSGYRFSNAFALAPYTLCSVPTMITGRSFLHHGVVQPGLGLDPDARTLAEILAELGYQTVAFSATPNNARRLGFDQGYEHFVELWQELDAADAGDPHRLVELVRGFLADRNDPRPLHLQVHMVPPHEPYDPPPAFALFGDPDYHGTIDGSRATIDGINSGDRAMSPADLAELIALYDGNLRRADDAVGQLLDVLAARERWDRTVVLVTADHGEAFLEHGIVGHNATLYDEMLRVPFILSLPPALPHQVPDTNRLVTLADITPTLVGLAGGRVPGHSEGVDLLAADGNIAAAEDRVLIARTAYLRPEVGIRSARWKLLLSKTGRWRLFDLDSDPHETIDIMPTHPAVAAGMAALLWHLLAEPPELTPMQVTTQLSPETAAMLKELGYTD